MESTAARLAGGRRNRRAVSDGEEATPCDMQMQWRRRRRRRRHAAHDCGGHRLAGVGPPLRRHALLLSFLACFSFCLSLPHLRLERTLRGRGDEARGGAGGAGRGGGQRERGTMLLHQGSSRELAGSGEGHNMIRTLMRRGGVHVLRQKGGMEEGVVDGETATTLTDPAYTQVKDFMALERIGSFADKDQGSEAGSSKSRIKKSTIFGLTRVHLGSKYAWLYPDPPWGRKDIHRSGSKFLRVMLTPARSCVALLLGHMHRTGATKKNSRIKTQRNPITLHPSPFTPLASTGTLSSG